MGMYKISSIYKGGHGVYRSGIYKGVNVVVSRPNQGDAVYVPTTSVYSSATPGSGVTEGSVTFVAGDTVDNAKMTAAGFTALGVVASVSGNKCYVLYKNVGAAGPFFTGATSSAYTIPSDKLSDADINKIKAGDAEDTQGLVGFRATCQIDVLFAWLTGRGGERENEGWNGGTNGLRNDFLNGADWGLTLGPAASDITAHDTATYKVAETIAKFGAGEAGFRKYLESRRLAYPSSLASNSVVFQDGKAATKVLVQDAQRRSVSYGRFCHFVHDEIRLFVADVECDVLQDGRDLSWLRERDKYNRRCRVRNQDPVSSYRQDKD